MDLSILKRQEKEKFEYFWSLVIGKAWVEAGIWRVVGEKTEVLARGAGASWEEENSETLIQAADSTFSAAVASFEQEAEEPNKVVFGLPPSWVEDGDIKKEKLELLKKLSEELELSPAGFVVLPEAIAHYLKSKEGAPPNAILVGALEGSLDVTLVENGKILGNEEVARSISLGADVAEGLARFSVLQYPPRIVLYNHRASDLEEARQSLLETDWEEAKVKFLHTPKVEILGEDIAVSAVSLAGGAEIGQAKSIELLGKREEEAEAAAQEEEEKEELKRVAPGELGFLEGEDVAQREEPEEEIKKEQPQPPSPVPEKKKDFKDFLGRKATLFSSLLSFLGSLRPPQLLKGKERKGILGITLFILLGLFIAATLSYWYLPKARVTVYVAPKKLEKEMTIKVDPELEVINQKEGVIPGRKVEAEVSGEKTKSTTGIKTVGDKARGEVTIYRVGPATTLSSGTILAGPNALEFSLDEDIQVASGSAGTPGTTNAGVTAADIGAQYNLAAGTVFTVGNFSTSDMEAKNDSAFSGGSSREISAVAEEDLEGLEEELTSELKSQTREKIKESLSAGEILVGSSESFRALNRDFSHREGEEAETLKLSMRGRLEALVVEKEAVNTLVMGKLGGEVPEGYLLRQEQIQVEFKEEEKEGFLTHVTANLLPQINPEDVARRVAGKYPEVAKQYLSTIPGFTRAEISLNVRLPGRLGSLPRLARNIVVEVAAER